VVIVNYWNFLLLLLFSLALWPNVSHGLLILGFLDDKERRTTVDRTPLDEWSARHRNLYLKTHNAHKRQISVHPSGMWTRIPTREQLQTYALDRADTGTGWINLIQIQKMAVISGSPEYQCYSRHYSLDFYRSRLYDLHNQ